MKLSMNNYQLVGYPCFITEIVAALATVVLNVGASPLHLQRVARPKGMEMRLNGSL